MIRAIKQRFCCDCGIEIVRIAEKHNRTQADSWEEWAARADMRCPNCYKKFINKKAEKRGTNFENQNTLPEILAESDELQEKACMLRRRYIGLHIAECERTRQLLLAVDIEKVQQTALAFQKEEYEILLESFSNLRLEKEFICMTETSAKAIISNLEV